MRIDFSPPDIRAEDIAAVVRVLESGWITTGPVTRDFEEALATFCGTSQVIAMSSCTAALEQALRISGVGPGDEVVVPAYTYSASAAVVHHVGADLVIVDSESGGYVPSPERIAAAVTSKTKAVIVVDVGGIAYPADLLRDELEGCGRGSSVTATRPVVIVDGAHSLGATHRGFSAGQLGDFTCFSFHAVKNLTTGEGGALTWRSTLVDDHEELATTLRRMILHGQSKDALAKSRAGSWEYDILELGHKENMPDILAALGLSQLARYEASMLRRHEILEQYEAGLGHLLAFARHRGVDQRSSAHLALSTIINSGFPRDELIRLLAERGVATNVHYKPLPMLAAYGRLGHSPSNFPNAMAQYEKEITLPLHTLLAEDDVNFVVDSVSEIVIGLQ